ncbi:DUF3134 family protein [Phormidium tenue FACHB-886]|nr:DUF3134 family protein [Phormidium tenue FACHB-886]
MVTLFNNPALHEVPQNQLSPIIPPRENESIFDWIESIDRFKPYESYESFSDEAIEELEELIGPSVYELDQEEE